ncbi:MAG: hypothetical protein INF91_11345 [Alphaproteobacteria bacterium]|nr:hypothetical protein [Alphaproteobacteria bacterium]
MDYGLIEIILTTVLVLAFAIWQLWDVNREIAKDKAKKAAEEKTPPKS